MQKEIMIRKQMNQKRQEILSPEESEEINESNPSKIWEESESENNINTEDFDLNQDSESSISLINFENSDTESELSDYNLQELF